MDYNENTLIDCIVEKKSKFYENICKDYNQVPFDMVVDYMFKVIVAQVDGMGELPSIKNALYHVFGGEKLSSLYKYIDLNNLLSGYESYLKKIYYLIHGEALKRNEGEGYATLRDAIMAFPSIRELRNSPKQEHRLLFSEMNILRNLRNELCYSSPVLTEKQLDSALDMVTDMYIFIIAVEIINIIKSSKSI